MGVVRAVVDVAGLLALDLLECVAGEPLSELVLGRPRLLGRLFDALQRALGEA